MEKFWTVKKIITFIVGALGAVITKLIGGWSINMITLIIFMAIDYLTGLIVAGVFNKSIKSSNGGLESKASWKGLSRKVATLMIVVVAHRLDITLGINYVRNSVVIGYIATELLSITENAGLMGIPLPKKIFKAVDVLKIKSDDTNL